MTSFFFSIIYLQKISTKKILDEISNMQVLSVLKKHRKSEKFF